MSVEVHKYHHRGEQEGEENHQRCGRCKASHLLLLSRLSECRLGRPLAIWQAQNYLLKIHSFRDVIKFPAVIRALSCLATATFARLHKALLIAI